MARMTGWGQDGPLARAAGHDLNYLALSGVLSLAARDGQAPMAPPTVLGDGGGALGLAFGVLAAVFAAQRSGKGCVVDCSIVDMAASLGRHRARRPRRRNARRAKPEPVSQLAFL